MVKKAKEVSLQAKSVLEEGGILTENGRKLLEQFDQRLIENDLNPGTTADFTASSIMINYLNNYKEYRFKVPNLV